MTIETQSEAISYDSDANQKDKDESNPENDIEEGKIECASQEMNFTSGEGSKENFQEIESSVPQLDMTLNKVSEPICTEVSSHEHPAVNSDTQGPNQDQFQQVIDTEILDVNPYENQNNNDSMISKNDVMDVKPEDNSNEFGNNIENNIEYNNSCDTGNVKEIDEYLEGEKFSDNTTDMSKDVTNENARIPNTIEQKNDDTSSIASARKIKTIKAKLLQSARGVNRRDYKIPNVPRSSIAFSQVDGIDLENPRSLSPSHLPPELQERYKLQMEKLKSTPRSTLHISPASTLPTMAELNHQLKKNITSKITDISTSVPVISYKGQRFKFRDMDFSKFVDLSRATETAADEELELKNKEMALFALKEWDQQIERKHKPSEKKIQKNTRYNHITSRYLEKNHSVQNTSQNIRRSYDLSYNPDSRPVHPNPHFTNIQSRYQQEKPKISSIEVEATFKPSITDSAKKTRSRVFDFLTEKKEGKFNPSDTKPRKTHTSNLDSKLKTKVGRSPIPRKQALKEIGIPMLENDIKVLTDKASFHDSNSESQSDVQDKETTVATQITGEQNTILNAETSNYNFLDAEEIIESDDDASQFVPENLESRFTSLSSIDKQEMGNENFFENGHSIEVENAQKLSKIVSECQNVVEESTSQLAMENIPIEDNVKIDSYAAANHTSVEVKTQEVIHNGKEFEEDTKVINEVMENLVENRINEPIPEDAVITAENE